MVEKELQARREYALIVAKKAGNILRARHNQFHTLTWKAKDDLKTEADDASEELITRLVREAFPDDSICAEEGRNTVGTSLYTWFIDPLDGTNEFMLGFSNYFAVSIGIATRARANSREGIIDIPLRTEMYYSTPSGAYCYSYRKQKQNTQRIFTATPDIFSHAVLAIHGGKEKSSKLKALKLHEKLTGEVTSIPRVGSAAVCLALVASGRMHGYIGFGLESWDVAGGAALIQAAGGCVTTHKGTPWHLFPYCNTIVAAHPNFIHQLLDLL